MTGSLHPWHARGLVFENCNCQLLCPGHVSFKQPCSNERCVGNWALHVDAGRFDAIDLAGLNAVIVFDAPQRMYEGGWTLASYIDKQATTAQRSALDTILSGHVGGPWAILDQFVTTRLATEFVPMQFHDEGRKKRLTIPDRFDTTVTAIRGADGQSDAVIQNLHNVLHGPVHTLARGHTQCRDRVFDFINDRTHGLYSRFSWTGNQ